MGKNLKSLSVHLAKIKNFRKLQQGQEKLTKNIKNQIEPKRKKTKKQAKQKQQKQKKKRLSKNESNVQKQPPEVFCKKRCSLNFRKIHRKSPVPESLF